MVDVPGGATTGPHLAELLVRAGQAAARMQQRATAVHGITPTALGALGVLARDGGLSHRDLAAGLGVTPATLTPVLDALERGGSVRRLRDDADRRTVRVTLTVAGRELLAAASRDVGARLGTDLPTPPPEHEAAVRAYLLAVLTAGREAE